MLHSPLTFSHHKTKPIKKIIMVRIFFIFSILLLVAHFGTGAALPKDIFLLGGGYNMAGEGGVRNSKWDTIVPEEATPSTQILAFNPRGNTWGVAREPLHIWLGGGPWGVGPGIVFARQILAQNRSQSGVIGLVPCAQTDSAWIVNWGRGKPYYNEMVRRAKESVKDGGSIRALLWYQGEEDASLQKDVDGFKNYTETFFQDLRSDLNLPNLLIIQVAIASSDGSFTEQIRKYQLEMKVANVKLVDARGLSVDRNKMYLETTSQVSLGKLLAQAYVASL